MRIALVVLLSLLLVSSLAYGDEWDDDAVITSDTVVVSDNDTAVDISAAGPHYYGNSSALGMYFGSGDEIIGREVVYVDGLPYTTRSRAITGSEQTYHDDAVYAPGYGSGAYAHENVYGPLWGVPSDAVGMEGYDPYYFYQLWLLSEEGAELTGEQRHQLETLYANQPSHAGADVSSANQHAHADDDSTGEDSDTADADGLDIVDVADDWLD
jgi:hypothetical protein